MLQARWSALVLTASLVCGRMDHARARTPVVDPYYKARQSAIANQSPASESVSSEESYYEPQADMENGSVAPETAIAEDGTEYVPPGVPVYGQHSNNDVIYAPGPAEYNGCGAVDGAPGAGFHGGALCTYGDAYLDDGHGGLCPPPRQSALWQEVRCHYRCWAALDYVSFWLKGDSLPPLVTTSPDGTSQSSAGVLGLPETSVVFGDERVNTGQRQGARVQGGIWLVDGEFLGLDASYYALTRSTTQFDAASNFTMNPFAQILARPFFNTAINMQDSLVLAFPNFLISGIPVDLNGQVSISSSSNVQSGTAGGRHLLFINFDCDHRLFLTGGYRFFRLDEDVRIFDQINPVGAVFLPGTFFAITDNFLTENQFHGGYVGLFSDLRRGRFSLQTQAQLAMGNMHEVVKISGSSTTFDGIATTTTPVGLLAKPTNNGKHIRDQFALIPEVECKLGYQVLPRVRLTAGYNFTYITRVQRPGGAIDLAVNPNQTESSVNGTPRPAPFFHATNVWVQGFTSGVEFRF